MISKGHGLRWLAWESTADSQLLSGEGRWGGMKTLSPPNCSCCSWQARDGAGEHRHPDRSRMSSAWQRWGPVGMDLRDKDLRTFKTVFQGLVHSIFPPYVQTLACPGALDFHSFMFQHLREQVDALKLSAEHPTGPQHHTRS